MLEKNSNKLLKLLLDLYMLRYKRSGDEDWKPLTNYLQGKLVKDGFDVRYDDDNEDVLYETISIKNDLITQIKKSF